MEGQIRPVAISDEAQKSLEQIYVYGIETFAYTAATMSIEELIVQMEKLTASYLLHPEYRYIPTKSQMYRNVIFGSYLIILSNCPG